MNTKLLGALAFMLLLGAGCTTTGTIDTQTDVNSQMPVPGSSVDEMIVTEGEGDLSNDIIDIQVDAEVNADADVAVGEVKLFTVTGGNFSFSPSTMTVQKGDTVKITFVNGEGFHDFKIDDFDVSTKQIAAGVSETVEFVADKAGSFEYYCSVGSHRAMGMKGTLTVTE